MKTLLTLLMLSLLAPIVAQAQADSAAADPAAPTWRRSQFRVQGGAVPMREANALPLLNLNYHYRAFAPTRMGAGFGPSIEVGTNWIFPYAEAGLEFAGDVVSMRGMVGVQSFVFYSVHAIPYGGGAVGLRLVDGSTLDLEIEGKLIHLMNRATLGAVSVSLNFH